MFKIATNILSLDACASEIYCLSFGRLYCHNTVGFWFHNIKNVAHGETSPYYIQGVSRLQGITAGGDFLGFCDQKSSYKHVSDFGRLWSYGRFLISVHALV